MEMEVSEVDFVKEEEYAVLIFQDGNNQRYFQIQDAYEYDEQDISLNMNTYYIERDDQKFGMYGGIERVDFFGNLLVISLIDSGRKKLGIPKVEMNIKSNSYSKIKNELLALIQKHNIPSSL